MRQITASHWSVLPNCWLYLLSSFSFPAFPSHGESGMLPWFPPVPVRPLCPGVHGVRPGHAPVPPALPESVQRVLQAHGDVWGLLARGYGMHKVRKSIGFFIFQNPRLKFYYDLGRFMFWNSYFKSVPLWVPLFSLPRVLQPVSWHGNRSYFYCLPKR